MGRRTHKDHHTKSHTLPSSPTHSFSSSSSSDFEFTIAISPRKSSTNLCPADELFYKGQLLPLHLSPRISMVRTLILASSSTSSSSDTTTTASRDSSGSSADSQSSFSSDLILLHDCDSSRPSSVSAEENDQFKRLHNNGGNNIVNGFFLGQSNSTSIKKSKYFSRLSLFSSVFGKESKNNNPSGSSSSSASSSATSASSVKRISATAREVIRKYLKKVKPLYEKLSQKQQQQQKMASMRSGRMSSSSTDLTYRVKKEDFSRDPDENYTSLLGNGKKESGNGGFSHSFSGNLRYPRRGRSYVSSCPSSMRSSPSHSGFLCNNKTGFITPPMSVRNGGGGGGGLTSYGSQDAASMEELQNAIQGAIAHCKNSMLQNNNSKSPGPVVGNEI